MKSATFPAVRVTPEMRKAAENVLRKGETLSGFVEDSLRSQIAYRVAEEDFVTRGLKAAEEARATGVYHSAESVIREMEKRLESAKSASKKRSVPAPRGRTSRR
jgi:hypothetical protein